MHSESVQCCSDFSSVSHVIFILDRLIAFGFLVFFIPVLGGDELNPRAICWTRNMYIFVGPLIMVN